MHLRSRGVMQFRFEAKKVEVWALSMLQCVAVRCGVLCHSVTAGVSVGVSMCE